MQQLEAEMRHLEDCVREAFHTLPPGITWDDVPARPDAQAWLLLRSDTGRANEFKTSGVFGRAAFGFNLSEDSQVDIVWLMRSIREQLKHGQFRYIKITKKFEGFISKTQSYRKLYMKVGFYGSVDIPFRFEMEWAAAVPQKVQ
jgi:hypothetical protein